MTNLETVTSFIAILLLIFIAGVIIGHLRDSLASIIFGCCLCIFSVIGVTLTVLFWLPVALETHPATPVEANTPVELLEVEHQRVVDSIEREYTIELKELELKQLKQLK